VPAPVFQTVSFGKGREVAEALAEVPAQAGVGQILGPDGRNLVIGRAAHLRRWAAGHLGSGPAPKKGERPRTDLKAVAEAIRYATTTSSFQQRLVYERLMARHVPLRARRDLRPPATLHLDPAERFPRVSVRSGWAAAGPACFGPFRDRGSAHRALAFLHKRFPLRPCDYAFEPHPELPLGLGCIYFQVRTCAAPCVQRIDEAEYRELARKAARFLAAPWERPAEAGEAIPAWVGAEAGSRALVVESTERGVELFPVRDWGVIEESSAQATLEGLEAAIALLRWSPVGEPRNDRAWLLGWLHGPRRASGALVPLWTTDDPTAVAAAVRAALPAPASPGIPAPAD
jgi:hypothetical protein